MDDRQRRSLGHRYAAEMRERSAAGLAATARELTAEGRHEEAAQRRSEADADLFAAWEHRQLALLIEDGDGDARSA